MSTVKISELTALTSADAADELVIVDDSAGVTKKITHANLANFGSGTVTAGALALGTGTVTAGAIDFSGNANAAGMTSEVLDDYEEGTWTPTVDYGTITVTVADYVKIGSLVYVTGQIDDFSDRSTVALLAIGGLPFAHNTAKDTTAVGGMFSRYSDVVPQAFYISASGKLELYESSTTAYTPVRHSDLNNSNAQIYFYATYHAS